MTQSGRGDSFWARPADGHGGIDDPALTGQIPAQPAPQQPTPTPPPVPHPHPAPPTQPSAPTQQQSHWPPPQQQYPQQQYPQQQYPQQPYAPQPERNPYADMSAGTKRSRRSGCLWMVLLSLLATFALAIIASLLAGMLPAWRAMQVTPAIQLKSQ